MWRRAWLPALVVAVLSGVVGSTPTAVAAPRVDPAPPSVIFLGDSVTAGFGYFGARENAPDVSGSVNQPFPSSWYFGDNSLSDCSPTDGTTPVDQCSNNNWDGTPWAAGPWTDGPDAPDIAYSYQIARSQDPARAAPIENWAVTGSTPAQWDAGGPFNAQLASIRDTTVVMTLGANPILSSFLQIKVVGYPAANGACADSTEWLGWTGWWAYPPSYAVRCADQQWAQNQQSEHLLNVYKALLTNGNHVMVLQYYRTCPWSFGVWQPNGNLAKGPAAGNSCTSQTQKVSECSSCRVDGTTSQWAQALAAQNAMNDKIAAAVGQAQAWARDNDIDPTRIQMATPDQDAWAGHQAWSAQSWVFPNDTWIHPSEAGHAELARTVTQRTCQVWGQWCGASPAWLAEPVPPASVVRQSLRTARIPDAMDNRDEADLPNVTRQGHPVAWRSASPRVCRVHDGGDLTTGRADGTCRVEAYSAGGGRHASLRRTIAIEVS